jgi:hypothetical protein
MRASGGPSIRKELSNELLAVDLEDALRMNVSAMAVQVYVGGEFETRTVTNMTRMVDMGNRYGMPTLGVTAVGKDMVRDAQYFRLATRICAELGAQFVKTDYVSEGFETVTASCPVPIVMAGGKKLPEIDAPHDGLPRRQRGRRGRRHGPQHLPVGCTGLDDPGRAESGARADEARARVRFVPDAQPGQEDDRRRMTPVANAVMFFATRQTPTTGSTIPVDGGLPDATPR